MSHTKSIFHIVFRTKNGIPAIDERYERDVYNYIWSICKNQNCFLHRVGGVENHIHLLVELPPTKDISSFMYSLKRSSSFYIKKNKEKFPLFIGWAKGYYSTTYHYKDIFMVKRYIANQKEHHRDVNCKEEIVKILNDSHIDFDESTL